MPALTVTEYLGIKPKYVDGTNIGGSSFLDHAIAAASALNNGLCDVALICYGSNQRTASGRSEEHTSELQSLMRISYAVFCLKKKKDKKTHKNRHRQRSRTTHHTNTT